MHTCPFTWTDGWGSHSCGRVAEHGGSHRCECDASHKAGDPLRLYGGVDQNIRHFPKPFPEFVPPPPDLAAELMGDNTRALLRSLLDNRPKCPLHPDVLVEPDPAASQALVDAGGMSEGSGYRVTVHWKCPHPDHAPDGTSRGLARPRHRATAGRHWLGVQ